MRQLRILLADGPADRLARVEGVVTRLGHVVVAKETNLEAVATLTERNPPDVAIVVVSESGQHSLELIRHPRARGGLSRDRRARRG